MEYGDIRSRVLRHLASLYVPVTADDLSLYAHAVDKVIVSAEQLTELAYRDRTAFLSGVKYDSWICPALEFPDGTADYDYLTSSSWPVRSRLVDGGLSEAQELMLLRHLCDIISVAEESGVMGEGYDRLVDRINDLTIHIPGERLADMRDRRTVPTSDFIIYREIAEDMYGPLARTARLEQRAAVERIQSRPDFEKYFGGMQS